MRGGRFRSSLARLMPGRRAVTMTLGEWVEEYLETHQGERVTVAKAPLAAREGDRRAG
jgi:hypothetical protein